MEPYGLDACWLDVGGSAGLFGSGATIADEIRLRIRRELGLTVSVGVSFNKVFAKLGSDYKKPDATTVITRDNYRDLVWTLPVSDLLYVGPATTKKLARFGVRTVGDLANSSLEFLHTVLGKVGVMLWQFANGKDRSSVSPYYVVPPIMAIGNSGVFLVSDVQRLEYTVNESRATNCLRLSNKKWSGMNMPVMPPRPISRCQAITDIIESVAREQVALGRILSAEREKLDKITALQFTRPNELLKANRSVDRAINSVSRLEMVLQSKFELFEDCLCACPPFPMDAETE